MADADISQKETYFVAMKVFLEKDNTLFIFKDTFGDWDLPGGRVKKNEFETPLKDVIKRKMLEEVGDALVYELNEKPEVLMRHERIEASPGNPTVRIFGIGYRATWKGGEPKLGDHHVQMEWVDISTFKPEEYFIGGWLKGVQEYLAFRNN